MSAPKPVSFKKLVKGGRLPKAIVPIINPDKNGLDTNWTKGRDILDFPIFRAVLTGNPGSGKSTFLKNIIARRAIKKKPFRRIYVVAGSSASKEWDDIPGIRVVEQLPPEEKLARPNTLLILDDVDFKGMEKEDQELLPRLFKHFSSHFGLNIAVTSQNFTEVPVTLRRASNLFVVYRTPDLATAGRLIAERVGLPPNKAKRMLGLLKETHDHLLVDLIPGSEAPYRYNSVKKIQFRDK